MTASIPCSANGRSGAGNHDWNSARTASPTRRLSSESLKRERSKSVLHWLNLSKVGGISLIPMRSPTWAQKWK